MLVAYSSEYGVLCALWEAFFLHQMDSPSGILAYLDEANMTNMTLPSSSNHFLHGFARSLTWDCLDERISFLRR